MTRLAEISSAELSKCPEFCTLTFRFAELLANWLSEKNSLQALRVALLLLLPLLSLSCLSTRPIPWTTQQALQQVSEKISDLAPIILSLIQ